MPIVFLTAYYGLVDLAGLRGGRVGAGARRRRRGRHGRRPARPAPGRRGVRHREPGKWDALRALGVDEDHIASSRDLDFDDEFLAATGGRGVDVVLNSLAGEFVDASLRLLPARRPVPRDGQDRHPRPGAVAARTPAWLPGVRPARGGPGPDRRRCCASCCELFERGVLRPLPVTAGTCGARRRRSGSCSQARHVGKIVLTVPRPLDPDGTVLITGGTGALGALVARHLVAEHGVRHLLLASRRGPDAPGAAELCAELAGLGAQVDVVACDVADRTRWPRLLDGMSRAPADRVCTPPVCSTTAWSRSLTPEQLDAVLRAQGRRGLAPARADRGPRPGGVRAVLLVSPACSARPGRPTTRRRTPSSTRLAAAPARAGSAAVSLAWGLWAESSGMTGHLGDVDVRRMAAVRSSCRCPRATVGVVRRALASGRAAVVPAARPDRGARQRDSRAVHGIGRTQPRRGVAAAPGWICSSLTRQLAGVPSAERDRVLLEVVRGEAAAVLGHATATAVGSDRAFKELGFDSLTAVELRNRLGAITGLRLPTTVVFDYPTPPNSPNTWGADHRGPPAWCGLRPG